MNNVSEKLLGKLCDHLSDKTDVKLWYQLKDYIWGQLLGQMNVVQMSDQLYDVLNDHLMEGCR